MKKVLSMMLLIVLLVGCAKRQLDKPVNLKVTDNVLTFDAVSHATSYVLLINDHEVTINEPTYSFTKGDYEVRVKAVAKGYQDSPYSEIIKFRVLETLSDYTFTNLAFKYDKQSEKDLLVLNKFVTFEDLKLTNELDVTLTDYLYQLEDKTYIKKDKLKELDIKKHTFKLAYLDTIYDLTVEIINKNMPYLMDNQTLYVDEKNDLILNFDLLNGQIDSIQADENRKLSANDYQISNDTITIKAEYLKRSFSALTESNQMIFVVVVKKETNIQTILLFIKKG